MISIHPKKIKFIIYITAVFATVSVIIYLYSSIQIGNEVEMAVHKAKSLFPGDQIESLISVVESEEISLDERNKAVWALGQLGSEKALPILHKYAYDSVCDHERRLCGEELQKAINLCEGGKNYSAIIWRKKFKKEENPQNEE